MKPLHALPTALLAAATSLFAADPAPSRIEVVFANPETYTDVRESLHSPENSRYYYLDLIRAHLERVAPKYVAAGQHLTLTFANIDMAGEFEARRGRRANAQVRLIRDIYPPRMKFSHRLTDANGAVLSAGESDIIDVGFRMRGKTRVRHDEVFYEKGLLDDWLKNELGKRKTVSTQ